MLYDNQIDDFGRLLVSLVVFNGGSIDEQHLEEAFLRLVKLSHGDKIICGPPEFYKSLRLSVGALINRKKAILGERVVYDVFNPAVSDYLLHRFAEDVEQLKRVFISLTTIGSVWNLYSLIKDKRIKPRIIKALISEIYKNCFNRKSISLEYEIALIRYFADNIEWNETDKQITERWFTAIDPREFLFFPEIPPFMEAAIKLGARRRREEEYGIC